ncbi:MAG TPA: archaemetzincin family Zn-dependent metalloprotease [Bryobacteraceae bacterium]
MRSLYVGAMADADAETLAAIAERLGDEFAAPVRPLDLSGLELAYDAQRGQYASISALEALTRACPNDALKLIAVTGRDLFIPVLTFVFGHAQLGGRVAVVSLARLRQEFYGLAPNREVLLERAWKEALHETGHTFGLVHCADRTCAMSLSTNVRQIDSKHATYCGACKTRLGRIPREYAHEDPLADSGGG